MKTMLLVIPCSLSTKFESQIFNSVTWIGQAVDKRVVFESMSSIFRLWTLLLWKRPNRTTLFYTTSKYQIFLTSTLARKEIKACPFSGLQIQWKRPKSEIYVTTAERIVSRHFSGDSANWFFESQSAINPVPILIGSSEVDGANEYSNSALYDPNRTAWTLTTFSE